MLKYPSYPKQSIIQSNSYQNANGIFHRKTIKCVWTHKAQIVIIILRQNKTGGITLPDIKPYYKLILTKTVWHWYKDKHIDQ